VYLKINLHVGSVSNPSKNTAKEIESTAFGTDIAGDSVLGQCKLRAIDEVKSNQIR